MGEGADLIKAVEQKEREEHGQLPEPDSREKENQHQPAKQQDEAEKAKQNGLHKEGASIAKAGSVWLPRIVWWVCLPLIGVLGLCLLIFFGRRRVYRKRQERMAFPDRTQAVQEIGKELKRRLRKRGYGRRSERNDREYRQMLERELPEFQWEQAFLILQKAVFSKDNVTEEEYQMIYSLYSSLEQRRDN